MKPWLYIANATFANTALVFPQNLEMFP